jgi:hypothetical protein
MGSFTDYIMTKIFLGGTCAESTWRDELIPMLNIKYFNPVVEDWTPECQEIEKKERRDCDYCLYVITPKMKGVYSIAEVVQDSNIRPSKTIFCVLPKDGDDTFDEGQMRSLIQVSNMVHENGATVCDNLESIAEHVNG